MNEGTAIEFARRKMYELGIGERYIIRYRHFRLDPSEQIEVKAENHLFVFIYPYQNIKVSSKAGIYDSNDLAINEMQHVHRGLIQIENQSKTRLGAKFIQVIPLIKTNESKT
ncbi:MAG: hypothetical protein JKY54_07215 [Flavobacteriales bacterium]|nr:hypothetical protein [Flavobacteriales bacterium]